MNVLKKGLGIPHRPTDYLGSRSGIVVDAALYRCQGRNDCHCLVDYQGPLRKRFLDRAKCLYVWVLILDLLCSAN